MLQRIVVFEEVCNQPLVQYRRAGESSGIYQKIGNSPLLRTLAPPSPTQSHFHHQLTNPVWTFQHSLVKDCSVADWVIFFVSSCCGHWLQSPLLSVANPSRVWASTFFSFLTSPAAERINHADIWSRNKSDHWVSDQEVAVKSRAGANHNRTGWKPFPVIEPQS